MSERNGPRAGRKRDRARLRELVARHRIDHGEAFRLADHDPDDTGRLGPDGKDAAKNLLAKTVASLEEAQDKLYAQDRWALLLVFQAMDAAGKDGAIEHVMSGVNPQGCQVYSFKAPSAEELDHDWLWRHAARTPERGRIGIFNRSYYEETLVVRVHPEILATQRIPAPLVGGTIWQERFEDIRAFERHLVRNGTVVRKFFLHVSKEAQRRRFLDRLEEPEKNWKFSPADVRERERWDEYQSAYEDAIRHTASPDAPWVVVPADHKWYTRLVVAAAIVDALNGLDLAFPRVEPQRKRELERARGALRAER